MERVELAKADSFITESEAEKMKNKHAGGGLHANCTMCTTGQHKPSVMEQNVLTPERLVPMLSRQ